MLNGYKTTRRAFIFIIIISLFLSYPIFHLDASQKTVNTGHIVINEVAFNTTDLNARWFEIYNPTMEAVNLSGWEYYHASIYTPLHFPAITIYQREYIVFTTSINNFTSYWGVDDIRVYDWGVPQFPDRRSIWICDKNGTVDAMIDDPYEPDPTYYLNHSWARYKGGYDTDNFTNDFYDEATPTPGWGNMKSKFPNQVPTVSVTSPSGVQTVSGIITIAGNASDVDGDVQTVEIKIDNGDWITASGTTSWSYTWDTTKVSDGEHTISVRAYDGYDYSTIETVTVNVDNEKETPKGFIPGFGTTTIITIFGICFLLLRKQQRRKPRHKA